MTAAMAPNKIGVVTRMTVKMNSGVNKLLREIATLIIVR
jgi:hypothetical protein